MFQVDYQCGLGTFGERKHDKMYLRDKISALSGPNCDTQHSLSFLCLSSVESCSERGVRVCAV